MISDFKMISEDLHRIADWFHLSLSINTKKTLTMFLSHNSSHLTQDSTNSQISLRGHPLEKRTKVDYLEITIDDKLSFADHVFKTTHKAYGTL